MSFHAGGGDYADDFLSAGRFKADGIYTNYVRSSTTTFLLMSGQMSDLLMSGVPQRFPELRFTVVESGLGHLQFALESLDYHYKVAEVWKYRPEFKELPSETFKKQIFVNYWFERLDQYHVDSLGEDNIMFETDFPHTTCLGGKEAIHNALNNGLEQQPERVQDKVLWANASKLFNVEVPAAVRGASAGVAVS